MPALRLILAASLSAATLPALAATVTPAAARTTETLPDGEDDHFHEAPEPWLPWFPASMAAIPSMEPVSATVPISSAFGARHDPFRGTIARHAGLDFVGRLGTPVLATADGIVRRAGPTGSYGNLVEIAHGNGYVTRYAHLSRILVRPGAWVSRGQEVARIGSTGRSTGAHLHYEVRLDGLGLDPRPFLYETALPGHAPVPAGPLGRWNEWAALDAPDRLPLATVGGTSGEGSRLPPPRGDAFAIGGDLP